MDARPGDYIIYRLLEGTAGRQTVLTLNDRPTADSARRVTVVPVANEGGLRQFAWIERNGEWAVENLGISPDIDVEN